MSHLGSWLLLPFGIKLLTTNQAESYNNILKLAKKRNQDFSVSDMVLEFLKQAENYLSRISKGHYRTGGNWTLRPHLWKFYDVHDNTATAPKATNIEEIKEKVKAAINHETEV